MVTQLTLLLFLAHQRFASVQMKSPTMFWQKRISQGRCHGTFSIKEDHSSPILPLGCHCQGPRNSSNIFSLKIFKITLHSNFCLLTQGRLELDGYT